MVKYLSTAVFIVVISTLAYAQKGNDDDTITEELENGCTLISAKPGTEEAHRYIFIHNMHNNALIIM